jgi:ABC-type sulfate transport system substrate-binding protein
MTMYVVKVGTNVKTANPDSSDGDRFDFYGPFTRPVADELADEMRAEFAKHGPEDLINGEPVVEVTRLAAYTPTGYDAVARFVRG